MKRILLFLLIFITVAVLLLGSIVWYGWDAFETLFENRAGMAEGSEWVEKTYSASGLVEFIEANDTNVSMSQDGIFLGGYGPTTFTNESSLQLNPTQPRAIGLVGSIYLMTAYAEAFSTGNLNPDEKISFDDISEWQLPGIYEQAHLSLKEVAEESYPDLMIPLKTVVGWLPSASDIALYDYLLSRIPAEALEHLFERAGLEHTEPLVPFSGLYLMASEWFGGTMSSYSDPNFVDRKERGSESDQELRAWLHQYSKEVALSIHSGGTESIKRREALQKDHLGLTFMQERDALEFFPKSSTQDLTRFAKSIFQGNLVSESSKNLLAVWLGWAGIESEFDSTQEQIISQTGAIYDSRIGLLSGLHLVKFKQSPDQEERLVIQAGIFDQLPVGFWFHLSANHMHQDFLHKLMTDSTLFSRTERMIETVSKEVN